MGPSFILEHDFRQPLYFLGCDGYTDEGGLRGRDVQMLGYRLVSFCMVGK